MCRSIRVVLLLILAFINSALCAGSECINYLPRNSDELLSLIDGPELPTLSLYYEQVRIFPNITFNCSGSVVGWSMLAPLTRTNGGRPTLSIWNTTDENEHLQRKNESRLFPCMTSTISEADQIYLYENITEKPIEFEHGDLLGLFLRRNEIAMFTPYFIAKESFVTYYFTEIFRAPSSVAVSNFETDNMIPLISLHICSKEEDDYDACVKNFQKPLECIDLTDSPMSTINVSPSPTVNKGGTPSNTRSSSSDDVSSTVLIAAVTIPLSLTLLIISLLLLITLVYIVMSRRKKGETRKNGVVTIRENSTIDNEPQPYAEPSIFRSSPLPSFYSHTPLPPPPTDPAPSPPAGLRVQPTYAVLDGPSPSPPPPYLDLERDRAPPLNELPSPQYESIDNPRKGQFVRQDASDTST